MLFGNSAFSQTPFSALPVSRVVYVGVSGIGMQAELSRVIVDTAFNINAQANLVGVPMSMQLGKLGSTWIVINTGTDSVWTPIVT